jgi:indolepyruvate ferredoxin oxidoreductase
MSRHVVSLADRYDLSVGRVMLNGSQAIVRLTLMQKARDAAAGLDTGGFITGYRGSPLGALDTHFEKAAPLLEPRDIVFIPGLNEELAATAIWGAQQSRLFGEGRKDGVFCLWYGKGPGVDRSGDVFRHANIAGTDPNGGVLVLMGDDHAAESSTVAHQSEFALIDAMMPILHPAGVQEILDYGLLGLALSRFSGCWVGLKCVHDNVESTAVVDGRPDRIRIRLPRDVELPPGGLNIRLPDDRLAAEERLHRYKLPAARAFARINGIDRIVWNTPDARVGVVATGKSWLDLRQALIDLNIDEERARDLGLKLLKIGMVWPLDPQVIRDFAKGLELILVIEEKRPLLETQIRDILYHLPADSRPAVIGKQDEHGAPLLPAHGVLDPNMIAGLLGERLLKMAGEDPALREALAGVHERRRHSERLPEGMIRTPWYCAGCPHNTSTRLTEGARGYAGIGCHWLVQLMPERRTLGHTQMGGEGANWIGEGLFSRRRHVFQNMGDGTYAHSGILAIRACLAAGANITFKILCNDAVAMTGGQPIDGGITVPDIARQTRAEGVRRIAIVSDDPHRWPRHLFPPGTTFHHRDELPLVEREMASTPGVSIIIYDQVCAAERRRRRRRGLMPPPQEFVVINEELCEGCGDCGVQSNCVALVPVETPWGRKRQVDQSLCNHDYTCLKGFCPAMVTVRTASASGRGAGTPSSCGNIPRPPSVPDVSPPPPERPWAIALAGIGGTGVVTIGQIIGHGAHLAGLGAGIIDMSGISQKNGTVITHLKLAATPEEVPAIRVADGSADLLLGFDILTTASRRILRMSHPRRTAAVVNTHPVMPGQFATNPDLELNVGDMKERLRAAIAEERLLLADTVALARRLFGDALFANMLALGMAWQKGWVPVPATALEEAIRLNGREIDANIAAFRWGRALAHDSALLRRLSPRKEKPAETLDAIVEEGRTLLARWHDGTIAEDYTAFIHKLAQDERQRTGRDAISRVVARQLARLTAIKDEYEVARQLTDPEFLSRIRREFGENAEITLWLAPPLLARRDPATGRPQKRPHGRLTRAVLPLLARMKGLRGTPFDIFAWRRERREEMAIAARYREIMRKAITHLTPANEETVLRLAASASEIRGFGEMRLKAFRKWQKEADRALHELKET